METPRAPFWNVWWTLTVISGALTIIVAALEAMGVFRDAGIFLSIAGAILTVVFGLSASTRSSLIGFRGEVLPRLDRLDGGFGVMNGRLGEMNGRMVEMNGRLGEMTERLDRIVTILDERLPRPAA